MGVEQNVDKYVQESDKGEGEGRGGMKSKIKVAQSTAKKKYLLISLMGKKRISL